MGLAIGCNRFDNSKSSLAVELATNEKTEPAGYFTTPFQDESQFIVETILSDLAEQVFYAKHHQLPDKKDFSVRALEKPGSPLDAPVYAVKIALGSGQPVLQTELKVSGPIWSPEVYRDATAALVKETGLERSKSHGTGDTALLLALTDAKASTIEKENQKLSQALERDFSNPVLHEQAAVLVGAFALREHSGDFFEIRSPLCRLTAHLALAHELSAGKAQGVNGCIAEAMLQTLMNDEAAAVEKLGGIKSSDEAVAEWARTLEADNTGDYRPLAKLKFPSRIERIAWFRAFAGSVKVGPAWWKLGDSEKGQTDFLRIGNEHDFSVEMGHQLLGLSLKAELGEIATVYGISHGDRLKATELTNVLNQLPERCFGGDGKLRVIGWGQWAMFFQRQLCHAVEQNFDFMENRWGVPDEAKKFSAQCDKLFAGLRLYPFVRRFNCTDVASYHNAIDDGFKVTVATPQLVPAECWNYLCYRPSFAERYTPNPNPHVNEWHKHNPPPGTVYNLEPRLDHPSLISRPDATNRIAKLYEMAPYDENISDYILQSKYHKQPAYEQAVSLYRPVLDYKIHPMTIVAGTVCGQPERYEKLMSAVAELNPSRYFALGEYFRDREQEDKAAVYYEKAVELDSDTVEISNYAGWLVKYYLKKGQIEKARDLANMAGEVYSSCGLQSKGEFLEATGKYFEAFDCYLKLETRYDDSGPIIGFCLRYKAKTGDNQFDSELQKRSINLFPKGIETVSLSSFQSPPTDGVLVAQENDLVRKAGLHARDVIVAIYGIRVHNFKQYVCGRGTMDDPVLDLIVWQHGSYHEIKASPPNHRFGTGADFTNYLAK